MDISYLTNFQLPNVRYLDYLLCHIDNSVINNLEQTSLLSFYEFMNLEFQGGKDIYFQSFE